MDLWFANLCWRASAACHCLCHAWRGDVPVIRRWEWLVFAVKALYLPVHK